MGYQLDIGSQSFAKFAEVRGRAPSVHQQANVAHIAKALLADRRARSSYFSDTLFADPAWDILLILTVAESRYRRLSVSQLCERVDVPATTALRWINALADQALLVRRDDHTDRRRKYIELSRDAYGRMVDYCLALRPAHELAA